MSNMDEDEQHFIGDLLIDGDVNGIPTNNQIDLLENALSPFAPSTNIISSSVGSPMSHFEPPPPYSPPITNAHWKQVHMASHYPPPAMFGHSPAATTVTRTDFYAPYSNTQWDPMFAPNFNACLTFGSEAAFPQHVNVPLFNPFGNSPSNAMIGHHYRNMYHNQTALQSHSAWNQIPSQNVFSTGSVAYPANDYSSFMQFDSQFCLNQDSMDECFYFRRSEQVSPSLTLPSVTTAVTNSSATTVKSYRDAASRNERVLSDSSNASSNSCFSNVHTSAISTGKNGSSQILRRNPRCKPDSFHPDQDAPKHLSFPRKVTRNSSDPSKVKGKKEVFNEVEKKENADHEFRKIIHKRNKGTKGKNESLSTLENNIIEKENHSVDASSRFEILQSLNGNQMNSTRDETRQPHAQTHRSQSSNAFQMHNEGNTPKTSPAKDSLKDVTSIAETKEKNIRSCRKHAGSKRCPKGDSNELLNKTDASRSVRKQKNGTKKQQNLFRLYFGIILLGLFSLVKWLADSCVHLVVDVALQLKLITMHILSTMYNTLIITVQRQYTALSIFISQSWRNFRLFDPRKLFLNDGSTLDECGGLYENIHLPTSGDDAMERLVRCRWQDAYAILGVRADCSEEEIKRYYKRQAALLHPDKNRSEGAEEAFKILSIAFEMICTPEARMNYKPENFLGSSLRKEMDELWLNLHMKVEESRKFMYCDCGSKHVRTRLSWLHVNEARYCKKCRARHPAKHNDIWAETKYWFNCFGWVYYVCLDGIIYDVTKWAYCPSNKLKYMKANSHTVQYRLVNKNISLPKSGTSKPIRNRKFECSSDRIGSLNRNQTNIQGNKSFEDFAGFGFDDSCKTSQHVTYRPPERLLDNDRPRRAGRRRKMR